MLNNTKSKIVIEMKHIDHANSLYDFLERVRDFGNQGGDLDLTVGNDICHIGHDVNIRKVQHIIFRE